MSSQTGRKDGSTGVDKLTYSTRETCKALGVSASTLERMRKRGLVVPLRGLGIKLYSVQAIRRFVEEGGEAARRASKPR